MPFEVTLAPTAEQTLEGFSTELRAVWDNAIIPELQLNPHPRAGANFYIISAWDRAGNRLHALFADELPGKIVDYVVEPEDPTGEFLDVEGDLEGFVVIFDISDDS